MSNLPFSHIVGILNIEGKSYDIESFNTKFTQPIDYKGQPQHEIRGGQLQSHKLRIIIYICGLKHLQC